MARVLEAVDDGGGDRIDGSGGSGVGEANLGVVSSDSREDRVDKQSTRHVDGLRVHLRLEEEVSARRTGAVARPSP